MKIIAKPKWIVVTCLAAIIIVSGAVFTTKAQQTTPTVTITVDETTPTNNHLASDFVGLSYDEHELTGAIPALSTPTGSNLVALLKNLGQGNIRIGGNTADREVYWQTQGTPVTPPWTGAISINASNINQLAQLLTATNWRAELAVNLGHLDPASITDEASMVTKILGPQLAALECGNEPNSFNAKYPTQTGTYAQYKTAFDTCAQAIRAATTTGGKAINIAGPDTTGSYITNILHDPATRSQLSMITQHAYTLSACGSSYSTGAAAISALLSPTSDTTELHKVQAGVKAAQPLPYRLDETNSAVCGGIQGVSDTYASTLWGIDYMLLMAQNGVAGVNFHGSLGRCGLSSKDGSSNYYTPLCAAGPADMVKRIFTAQPLYYSMLFVSQIIQAAGTGTFYPTTVTANGNNITAYAVQGSNGKTQVIVLDKDPTGASVNIAIKLTGKSSLSSATPSLITLAGTSLGSPQGITLQGQIVSKQGTFPALIPDTKSISTSAGDYTIAIPTGSATLLTI